MAKTSKGNDEMSTTVQLLRTLLAIELWRGGLSQAEIGKRLGISTKTVNPMLKSVRREILSQTINEE